jgi:hypothetical protein
MPNHDLRRHAPATERNREPIFEVLANQLPPAGGLLLELASGTGEHAARLAPRLAGWTWQPSDPDAGALDSIAAWRDHLHVEACVRPPLRLDASSWPWPLTHADALLCVNMIHISPWDATEGLMRGAGALLPAGGRLLTYGPYKVDGQHTAPSNAAFDQSLRERDAAWGVRDVSDVAGAAAQHGLKLIERVTVPANNFVLVFQRDR